MLTGVLACVKRFAEQRMPWDNVYQLKCHSALSVKLHKEAMDVVERTQFSVSIRHKVSTQV